MKSNQFYYTAQNISFIVLIVVDSITIIVESNKLNDSLFRIPSSYIARRYILEGLKLVSNKVSYMC